MSQTQAPPVSGPLSQEELFTTALGDLVAVEKLVLSKLGVEGTFL
jgi:hypothetical protein